MRLLNENLLLFPTASTGGISPLSLNMNVAGPGPNSFVTDTTYAGEGLLGIAVQPYVFGLQSVSTGSLWVQDGIKLQVVVPTNRVTSPLQPYQSTFTDTQNANFSIGGRTIVPQSFGSYFVFTPDDLRTNWQAINLDQIIMNRTLPLEVTNYLMPYVLVNIFQQVEIGTWIGSTAYKNSPNVPNTDPRYQYQYFDGLIKQFVQTYNALAPNTTQGIPTTNRIDNTDPISGAAPNTGTWKLTAGPTSASGTTDGVRNVGDAMADILTAVGLYNTAIITDINRFKNFKFLMGGKTRQLYADTLTRTLTFKGNNWTTASLDNFEGYEVVTCAGIPADTIVFTNVSPVPQNGNLVFGCNSVDDSFVKFDKYPGPSVNYYLEFRFRASVQYMLPEQVFLYTPLTAASFIP